MRNLKRALSLTLASVMLLGMMVVGSSAASYSDVSDEHNVEAIEVVKALGIMQGTGDGFDPDRVVSRVEMAAVVARMLGLDIDSFSGAETFPDVPDWAVSAVAACQSEGIVGGYPDGTFGSADPVNAVQAATMMLRVLGYFQHGEEDYNGQPWNRAVINQVAKINLFDGIDAAETQGLTRNEVSQLVLNTVEADVVEAKCDPAITLNGEVIKPHQVNYPVVVPAAGAHNYNGVTDGVQQLAEKLYGTKLDKTGSVDEFGRPANQWTYNTTTITAAKEPTLVYTDAVKVETIYADLGKPSGANVEDTNSTPGAGKIVIDGEQGKQDNSTADITTLAGNTNKVGGKGTLTEVFFDKTTGKINIVCTNTYLVQATADYNEKAETLAVSPLATISLASATLKAEDFPVVKNCKDEDLLLVTAVKSGSTYTIKTVETVDVVSDVKVSAYKASDYVTAGGTKYQYNAKALADSAALGQAQMVGTYNLQSTTYDLVLDNYGYVIGVKASSDSVDLSNYLYVVEAAKPGFEALAKVVFMDGTSKTITVDKVRTFGGTMTAVSDAEHPTTGAPSADGKLADGVFYTFTTNKNGNYELTAVEHGTFDASTTIVDNNVKPIVAQTTLIGNDKTVFVADGEVFTGIKNAPKVSVAGKVAAVYDDNNFLIAVYAEKAGVSSTSADELVYIYNYGTPASAKDENDNTYFIYDAVVNGEKTTINVNNNSSIDADGLWAIKKYDGDGYVDGASMVKATDAAPYVVKTPDSGELSYNNGVLTMKVSSTESNYILTDDVDIYVFDTTDNNSIMTVNGNYIKNLTISGDDIVYMVQESSTNTDIAFVYIVIK